MSNYVSQAYTFAHSFFYSLSKILAGRLYRPVRIETDPSGKEVPGIHFAKLIHRYVRSLPPGKSAVALQYLYLISLNGDLPDPRGREQIALCHNYITELVIETKAYGELVGSIDEHGVKQVRMGLVTSSNTFDTLPFVSLVSSSRTFHSSKSPTSGTIF